MDWSLLRPHAKHFLLRDELSYSGHVYVSVTNFTMERLGLQELTRQSSCIILPSSVSSLLDVA
jgi:hypothetical protein